MKKFVAAEIVELNVNETAYGKNMHAVEANANKHPNNGAGGRQPEVNTTPDPTIPGDKTDLVS